MSLLKDPPQPKNAPETTDTETTGTDGARSADAKRGSGLFRAFWRWHFYASFIVIPTVLVLAITGLVYLFRFQIEPAVHQDLMRVSAPADPMFIAYDEQLAAVAAARPDDTVVSMAEPAASDHSTRFTVSTPDELTRSAVDRDLGGAGPEARGRCRHLVLEPGPPRLVQPHRSGPWPTSTPPSPSVSVRG